MDNRSRSVVRGFVAALALLAVAAAPVVAGTVRSNEYSYTRLGLSAYAFAGECTDNGDGTTTCSGTGMYVFAGETRTGGEGTTRVSELCASVFASTSDNSTGAPIGYRSESGCTSDLGAGSVIAHSLRGAAIQATTVTFQGENCGGGGSCQPTEPRDVVVAGTFTAVARVTSAPYSWVNDDGAGCVTRIRSSELSREAAVSWTLDGQPIENALARILFGKFSSSVRCTI